MARSKRAKFHANRCDSLGVIEVWNLTNPFADRPLVLTQVLAGVEWSILKFQKKIQFFFNSKFVFFLAWERSNDSINHRWFWINKKSRLINIDAENCHFKDRESWSYFILLLIQEHVMCENITDDVDIDYFGVMRAWL